MKHLVRVYSKIIGSYRIQFLLLSLLIFLGFYKTLNFSFHANREIGYLIGITGGNFSILNLIRSHGFISLLNYKLYGANPAGWYFTAILLHILATCGLVIFVNKLTGKKLVGFLAGLVFSISMSWHDTVTFGSQESMYSLQLFLFFVSAILYRRFRKTGSKKSYMLSFFLLAIVLPLRELGLIFFPILFAFDLLLFYRYKSNKTLLFNLSAAIKFLIPMVPFVIISFLFLIFSKTSAENPNYYADERVKLQYALLTQRRYIEYLTISIASFGTFLPPLFIPYPFLNFVRNVLTSFLSAPFIKMYFFSILGYFLFLILGFLAYLKRKTPLFSFYLLSIAMIGIPIFFFSFAITMDKGFFLRDYSYDENRWRYFSFSGLSMFVALYFYELFKVNKKIYIRKIFISLLILNTLLNLVLLWREEDKMYEEMFRSQKLFYTTFIKTFPEYKSSTVLYTYPFSYSLGDYLWEWYNLSNYYYPKLKNIREDWVYGEMEKVLRLVKKNPQDLQNVRFIDFDPGYGIIDYSSKARDLLLHQKTVEIDSGTEIVDGKRYTAVIKEISPVEFPYIAKIALTASVQSSTPPNSQKNIAPKKLQALLSYGKSNIEMRKRKVDSVCRTHGNLLMFNPSNLVDGNFGPRSSWWVDCIPGWFIIDLGSEYKLSGFLMGGLKDDPLLPRTYTYEVSLDKKSWKTVMKVKGNTNWDIMDRWPNTESARYVRVSVDETQKGSFVMLDEAEPVLAQAGSVFDFWQTRRQLTEDLYAIHNYVSGAYPFTFIRFIWSTTHTTIPEDQRSFVFPIALDGQLHTYEIPIYESEYYSLPGQFLKRKIEKISVDVGSFPGSVMLDSVDLMPKIPIQ